MQIYNGVRSTTYVDTYSLRTTLYVDNPRYMTPPNLLDIEMIAHCSNKYGVVIGRIESSWFH